MDASPAGPQRLSALDLVCIVCVVELVSPQGQEEVTRSFVLRSKIRDAE